MSTVSRRRLGFTLAGLLALCSPVWADAGTAFVWTGAAHLLFGNLFLGLAEGELLTRFWSVRRSRSMPAMVLANYVSSWAGLYLLDALGPRLPIDLNNRMPWFWGLVVATWLFTLVVEWPFLAWCLRGRRNWLETSVRASLVIQTASYVVLFGLYALVSTGPFRTGTHRVAPSELALPHSVLVYYISPKDGNVYVRSLAGKVASKVFDLGSHDEGDGLFVRPGMDGRFDLYALLHAEARAGPRRVVVVRGLDAGTGWDARWDAGMRGAPRGWIDVARLGSAAKSAWEVGGSPWPSIGLYGSNRKTNETFRVAYATPLVRWRVSGISLLPKDKVLFQLGRDQICALDPATRKIALLWHGRSPVPVLPRKGAPPASPAGAH